MGKLSFKNRYIIVELLKAGKTQREISRTKNISQSTIRKLWLKYQDTGSMLDRSKTGRPSKTNEHDHRLLTLLSKRDAFKSAPQLHMEANLDKKCSVRSTQRILCRNHLFG